MLPTETGYCAVKSDHTIPHSRPLLGDDLVNAALEISESGMIASGRRVEQFEDAFARMHCAPAAVATNSGTAALHLALVALDIGEGDEVILPGYVCTAVLNAVRYVRATAVLADVDEHTFNIDPGDVASRLTSRTRAIIVPHMFGRPADVPALKSLGVPVIEDCAQALGAGPVSAPVGSLGDLAIFSFYATKVITTGTGGMVVGRDPALLDRIRDLRDYDEKDRYVPRFSYQMTDLAAAIGLRQLRRLPEFIRRRRSLAAHYSRQMAWLGCRLPGSACDGIAYRYVIRTESLLAVQAALAAQGVQAKRPVYKPLTEYIGGYLPATEGIYRTALSIPIYPSIADAEVERVVSALAFTRSAHAGHLSRAAVRARTEADVAVTAF